MMKNKRRKAETLVEILIAIMVFGIAMKGISEVIANQTLQASRIKKWDKIMAQIPKAMAYSFDKRTYTVESLDGVSPDFYDNTVRFTLDNVSWDLALH